MSKRILLFTILLAVLVAAIAGYRMFAAHTPKAEGRSADVTLSAKELYDAFTSDETAAGLMYNDKVVQVSGAVREITKEDGRTTVLLETGDALGAVVCELDPSMPAEGAKGDLMTIKGFCAGYNMDVLLQRCAVVK